MDKSYIGVYEFARRTGRDITSLYKLLYAGKLRGEKHGKRGVWRIPVSEVAQWDRERKQPQGE